MRREIVVPQNEGCSERRRDRSNSQSITRHNSECRPPGQPRNAPKGHTLKSLRRFPARSTHLFRRETGVRMPLSVEKFYGSIRQKAPSERRKLIDESAKLSFRFPQGIESIFERWTALVLTDIHNRVFHAPAAGDFKAAGVLQRGRLPGRPLVCRAAGQGKQ